MPATWPDGVPYRVLQAGASAPEGEVAMRSPTDSGFQRQRAEFTAALDEVTGNIRMTWAQYLTFRAFRKGLGGGAFTWAGYPGGSVTARFKAGAQGAPSSDGQTGTEEARRAYAAWAADVIASRNVAGLADPSRHNLYPADLDLLIERHSLLGMSRQQLVDALPALRGMTAEPPALTTAWARAATV